jgi:hypothetical protein
MIAPFAGRQYLTVLMEHFQRITGMGGTGYRFPAEMLHRNGCGAPTSI